MKRKILVVEDEEGLRLFYKEELEAEGYDVLTAGNGREAIQQLETEKPDLVILDIVMPVMDGMEALGRIVGKEKKDPRHPQHLLFEVSRGFYELGSRCLRDEVR